MSFPSQTAEAQPEAVRTLEAGRLALCPVCRAVPLQGRQTACSAACRRARCRQREFERQRRRDRELRSALELVIGLAQDALGQLREEEG
jgi:hypothetical protein